VTVPEMLDVPNTSALVLLVDVATARPDIVNIATATAAAFRHLITLESPFPVGE
jgi:hypothetical protein